MDDVNILNDFNQANSRIFRNQHDSDSHNKDLTSQT